MLKCGHQCASFCAEPCPEKYCQLCSDNKKDARVDLLELKTFAEIDLDENPIAVLGCGHFFTRETLDGLVGMSDVYTVDKRGDYNGLKPLLDQLAAGPPPSCPDCKQPIRQFATRRYNRVVNRAILMETNKRFVVGGMQLVTTLEALLEVFEKSLSKKAKPSLSDTRARESPASDPRLKKHNGPQAPSSLEDHFSTYKELVKKANQWTKTMVDKHQPTKKLTDAIVASTLRQKRSSDCLEQGMKALNLSDLGMKPAYDNQLSLRASMVQLKARELWTLHLFKQGMAAKTANRLLVLPEGVQPPKRQALELLAVCLELTEQLTRAKLPRLVMSASLTYAKVAHMLSWHQRNSMSTPAPGEKTAPKKEQSDDGRQRFETARRLLSDALILAKGLPNCKDLVKAVQSTLGLFVERYEEITPEELAAIKSAMVGGSGGLATHSGHWYNCVNGHPFAIGECGMPMQRARCPECNAPIGGQNHTPVAGVTRARNME